MKLERSHKGPSSDFPSWAFFSWALQSLPPNPYLLESQPPTSSSIFGCSSGRRSPSGKLCCFCTSGVALAAPQWAHRPFRGDRRDGSWTFLEQAEAKEAVAREAGEDLKIWETEEFSWAMVMMMLWDPERDEGFFRIGRVVKLTWFETEAPIDDREVVKLLNPSNSLSRIKPFDLGLDFWVITMRYLGVFRCWFLKMGGRSLSSRWGNPTKVGIWILTEGLVGPDCLVCFGQYNGKSRAP